MTDETELPYCYYIPYHFKAAAKKDPFIIGSQEVTGFGYASLYRELPIGSMEEVKSAIKCLEEDFEGGDNANIIPFGFILLSGPTKLQK